MKRLLVLFTGGTIGSKTEGLDINVNKAGSYALLDEYRNMPSSRGDVELEAIQPLNLLSENITPQDWITLAGAVKEADWTIYEGIIVTHGSDTLAYTAAMMSCLFADIPIPLVLTASNYPIADERSNGLRNLSSCIDFVLDAKLPGVYVVYENDKKESLVYLGTRIMQNESFTDQFRSPYELPFGEMKDRRFHWRKDDRNPLPDTLRQKKASCPEWDVNTLKLEDGIVYIRPYPGLNYCYYDFTVHKPRAILHDLHHSGTASALESGAHSLIAFIERCRANDIDCYLCPIKDASDALYASSRKLIDAGAKFIENMSIEAALTKLMFAYGMYDREQAEVFVLQHNIYYETIQSVGGNCHD